MSMSVCFSCCFSFSFSFFSFFLPFSHLFIYIDENVCKIFAQCGVRLIRFNLSGNHASKHKRNIVSA